MKHGCLRHLAAEDPYFLDERPEGPSLQHLRWRKSGGRLTFGNSRLHAPYAAALRREVEHYLGECNPPTIRTLYFGGRYAKPHCGPRQSGSGLTFRRFDANNWTDISSG